MLLVDTSVWIDHLRSGDATLTAALLRQDVLVHDFVIGEVALGALRQRDNVLGAMRHLPRAVLAADTEVLKFIDDHALHGLGIGYVDAHLLASTRLTRDAQLWTRDKRLGKVAAKLGLSAAVH